MELSLLLEMSVIFKAQENVLPASEVSGKESCDYLMQLHGGHKVIKSNVYPFDNWKVVY